MSGTLSQKIRDALSRRDSAAAIVSLAELRGDSGTGVRLDYPAVLTAAKLRHWCAHLQSLVRASAPPPGSGGGDGCDVGLLCGETFWASVVESACLALGASFCVFNPSDPPLRRQRLLDRRKPRVLLAQCDVERAWAAVEASAACAAPPPWPWDTTAAATAVDDDDSVAYYMCTSGSTGEPKCVLATRGNLNAYLTHFVRGPAGMRAADGSVFLTLSTPFFDPSVGEVATALSSVAGAHVCLSRAALLSGDLGTYLRLVRPTHVVSTPAVWAAVGPPPPPPLPQVFLGGERMPQALLNAWSGATALHNVYGVTEATVYQSCARVPPGAAASDVHCGCGTDGARVLVRPLHGKRHGEGEVLLRGPQVCRYADDGGSGGGEGPFEVDGITGERQVRTGDVGSLAASTPSNHDSNGGTAVLRLHGRLDWQLKVSGQRVSLEEVEGTLARSLSGAVLSCCCCPVAVGSPAASVTIGCGAVLADCASEDDVRLHRAAVTEALEALAAAVLPAYMVPRRWLLLPRGAGLPLTPTGKVDRQSIAAAIVERQQALVSSASDGEEEAGVEGGGDGLYSLVKAVWARQLPGARLSSSTNFMHSGGDSLGALRVTRALHLALHGTEDDIDEWGGLPPAFQPQLLLAHPTLAAYVAAVRRALPAKGALPSSPSAADVRAETAALAVLPGDALLLRVVSAGCAGLARALVEAGVADVNAHNSRERRCVTPLHAAAASPTGGAAMASLLLSLGAHPTAVTAEHVTPGHLAAAQDASTLAALLAAPADRAAVLHCRDGRQQSLLHFAARAGNSACVRLLLSECPALLGIRDKWQRTAAHWALLNGHRECLACMADALRTAVDTEASREGEGLGRKRQRGSGAARHARLARRKTHLPYESLAEMTRRVYGDDNELLDLAAQLDTVLDA